VLRTFHRYSERVKALSVQFKDQPQTPLERAVFWSEYVIRHKGAVHLRSSARELNFFQYFCIDVAAFLFTIVFVFLLVVKIVLYALFRKCCGKGRPAENKSSAKKRN